MRLFPMILECWNRKKLQGLLINKNIKNYYFSSFNSQINPFFSAILRNVDKNIWQMAVTKVLYLYIYVEKNLFTLSDLPNQLFFWSINMNFEKSLVSLPPLQAIIVTIPELV